MPIDNMGTSDGHLCELITQSLADENIFYRFWGFDKDFMVYQTDLLSPARG